MPYIKKAPNIKTITINSWKLQETDENIEKLDIQNCAIKIKDYIIPIYKLCYEKTAPKHALLANRTELAKKIASSLVEAHLTGAHREASIYGIISAACRFCTWSDSNKLRDAFESPETYRENLKSYSDHIYEKAHRETISESHAGTEITCCMTAGQWAFDKSVEYFLETIKSLKRTQKNIDSSTQPPDFHILKESYSLNKRLFEEISSFLIQKKKFPCLISLPKEKVWILPLKSWGATEQILQSLPAWGKSKLWNYTTGQLYSLEESISFHDFDPARAVGRCNERLLSAEQKLVQANTDIYCRQRVILGQWAHDAFLSLFAANTLANESSIRDILWSDEVSLKESTFYKSPRFRTIKYRAGGRTVEFEIRANALGLFDKYLSLRKHILNGRKSDYLFLSVSAENKVEPLKMDALRLHYRKIRMQLYPNFEGVGYRQWRATGGSTAFNAAGHDTAAAILQTSPRSIIRNYSKGTLEDWEKDLTVYFNAFTEEFKKYKSKKIPIGHCNDEGSPKPMDREAALLPDCAHFEGCLNCDKFSLHADEEDIRKILSMQYAILAIEPYSISKDHFNQVFKSLLKKIDWILSEISALGEDKKIMVDQLRHEVFDGEDLTDYWQAKVNLLVEMGVIN